MNKGPISRLIKVPVKCKNCGKIKYNVVCNSQVVEEKKDDNKQIEKKAEDKHIEQKETNEKVYKKQKTYSYINSVVKKQREIASSAYLREKQ